MNSKIVFTILIFAINFNAIFGQLSCNYVVYSNGYTCELTINNPSGLNNFGSISGTHVSGYTDSHVVSILAMDRSISPNIPSIICSKFTNVQSLKLNYIEIQRVDDYSFISCTALTYLSLANNNISMVHEKAFIRNLNFRTLNFDSNDLTTLPENIFQNLQNLETLWLSLNRFTDLPAKIFWSLTNLQLLNLRSSQLRNIRPEWFENLNSLTSLIITYNGITEFPKNTFSQLKNLVTLHIHRNYLRMIHADSFGFLPNLRTLTMDNNQVDAIDENLIDYTGVQHIDMGGNLCANKQISDPSISRDIMRAELRECFNNYERTMSVCRQHSNLFIESEKTQTCATEKQVIRELKEAWTKEKEELLATIKHLSINEETLESNEI